MPTRIPDPFSRRACDRQHVEDCESWQQEVNRKLAEFDLLHKQHSEALSNNTVLTREAAERAAIAAQDAKTAADSARNAVELLGGVKAQVNTLGGKIDGVADVLNKFDTVGRAMSIVARPMGWVYTISRGLAKIVAVLLLIFFAVTHWQDFKSHSFADSIYWLLYGNFPK